MLGSSNSRFTINQAVRVLRARLASQQRPGRRVRICPRLKDGSALQHAANRLPNCQKCNQSHHDHHELSRAEMLMRDWDNHQDDGNDQTHADAQVLGQHEVVAHLVRLVEHAVGPEAQHANTQTSAEQPPLALLKLLQRDAHGADVAGDEKRGRHGEMQQEEAKRGPRRATDRVRAREAAVAADIDPVEAKRNDEGADGLGVARREARARRVADNDNVHKLAEDDDEEGRHAVNLVRNVHGRAVAQLEAALEPRAQRQAPRQLLVDNHDGDDARLGADAHALDKQRDGDEQAHKHEAGHDARLHLVRVARKGADEEDEHRGEARGDVRPRGGAHRRQVIVDGVGVVGEQHQQRHDPEDDEPLDQVVGVVRVHNLAQVYPDVPRRRKGENVLGDVGAVRVLAELIAEVGNDCDIYAGAVGVSKAFLSCRVTIAGFNRTHTEGLGTARSDRPGAPRRCPFAALRHRTTAAPWVA